MYKLQLVHYPDSIYGSPDKFHVLLVDDIPFIHLENRDADWLIKICPKIEILESEPR